MGRKVAAQHDPFARPAWSIVVREETQEGSEDNEDRARVIADREETLRELQQQGVHAVVLGRSGKMAIIGSAGVRVGDVIEGFLVKEITTDGVILVERDARK